MIKVTVKTLDSQVKEFEVPEGTTAKQFKEIISSSVNVPAERQRLIFKGRVLADDKDLNQHGNVDGKALHLVERLPVPVSQPNRQATQPTNAATSSTAQLSSLPTMPNVGSNCVRFTFQMGPNGTWQNVGGNMQQGPQGFPMGQAPGQRSRPNNRPPVTSNNSNTTPQGPRPNAAQPQQSTVHQQRHHYHPNIIDPRRQLNLAKNFLGKLKHVIEHLAALDKEDEEKNNEDIPSTSGQETAPKPEEESMDTNEPPNPEGVEAAPQGSTENPSDSRVNPSLGELHKVQMELLRLTKELEPYWVKYMEFLETDPAFQSTRSPEYIRATKRINYSLQAQRLLGEIHRLLSQIAIPLSDTPPREMLLNPSLNHRHAQAQQQRRPSGTIVFHNQPMQRHPFPQISQVGVNVVRHTIPVQAGMFPSPNATANNPTAQRNAGLYSQVPSTPHTQMPHQTIISTAPGHATFGPMPVPIIAVPPTPVISNVTAPQPTPRTTNTVSSTPSSASNLQRSGRETMVNVTANIHPHININVMPYGTSASDTLDIDAEGQVAGQGGINLPNIPGLEPSTMQHILQTINQSINQEIEAGTIPGEAFGLDGNSQNENQQVSGTRFVVENVPENDNQMLDQIASLVGNTVENAVLNQMRNANTEPHPQTQEPVEQNIEETQESTTATEATEEPPAATLAEEVFRQVLGSNGRFGSMPSSSTSTSNPAVIDRARASNENNSSDVQGMLSTLTMSGSTSQYLGSLPKRQKVRIQGQPGCVNSMARNFGTAKNGPDLEESAIAHILHYAGEFLSTADVIALINKQHTPNITKACKPLREVLKKVFFNGKQPTKEQLRSLMEQESQGLESSLVITFALEDVIDGVDAAASNVLVYRYFLSEFLNILFNAPEGTYASQIQKHISNSVSFWVHVNAYLLKGGEDAVSKLISAQLAAALGPLLGLPSSGGADGNDFFMNLFQNNIGGGFVPFAKKTPKTYNDFKKFIVRLGSTSESKPKKSKEAKSESAQPQAKAIASGSKVKKTAEKKDKKDEGEPTEDDSEWKEQVPEEWVGIIQDDINKQKNMPTQPEFSEAYANGMPASKRRKVVS